jgi:hypothetical protein
MSRRPYQPTVELRRQVLTMTGLGLTQADICGFLNIDRKTLRKHFRHELDVGAVEANAKVAEALFANATRHNNVAAQVWWTKSRMGWRSVTDLSVTGIQTVQMQHLVAARAFSDALHNNPDALPAPEIDGEAAAPINLLEPAAE